MRAFTPRWGLLLLAVHFLAAVSFSRAAVEDTPTGILVTLGDAHIRAEAATPGAFRLSVTFGKDPEPNSSLFIEPAALPVSWQAVHEGEVVGIQTGAGELLIDSTTGNWTLQNAEGTVLVAQGNPAILQKDAAFGGAQVGLRIGSSQPDQPPFRAYGSGNGGRTPHLLQSRGASALGNGVAAIPYYWSPAGYAAFGVTSDDDQPAKWQADPSGGGVGWIFPGRTLTLYLMPAPDLQAAARNYADLTGHPGVPPEWTFGYLQSRWGWKDKAYIDDTLKTFRGHQLPVDAFIFDFESYTSFPDYQLLATGKEHFPDFAWNPLLFPDPAKDFAAYAAQGLHLVAIRKPRIGDRDTLLMLHDKGWIRTSGKNGERGELFDARGIDFENPAARKWYGRQLQPMIESGIAGWWNDEGESTYTKYYFWNQAEADALAKFRPNARHWSVNRAFQPGLQRFGVAAWTGDIGSSWETLARTPSELLNWSLAGMPYSACDIGGFKGVATPTPDNPRAMGPTPPEMFTRWMEAGVFFPVMRAHSTLDIPPHFPWLSGPEAEDAIRKALDLRSQLIPYYYSLAHLAHETGLPLMRPLAMEFPGDPNVADLSDQWLMGSGLMAAPILAEGGARQVYFPDDMVSFDGTKIYSRGQTVPVTAALDEIPLYVRFGTILPLGPVIQDVAQLPGGPLELRVYPGQDAAFTLVEDDGVSYDYLKGIVRKTAFTWDNLARTLTWKQEGGYDGPHLFRKMKIVLFDPSGRVEKAADLGPSGTVAF